jgi:hypothetical protein
MAMSPQPLSIYFGINATELDKRGVFNAYLGIDNLLFVDPRLLSQTKVPEFVGSRKELAAYFASVIKLLTASKKQDDLAYTTAVKRLTFREEHGAALGYSHAGGHGRAVGPGLATLLAYRGKEIIDLGINDPEIFELIGLFQEGFGPDLLSDMAVSILKHRFLTYSQRIAKELNLKPRNRFRWNGIDWDLPTLPGVRRSLVLVPTALLNELPIALDRSEIGQVAAFNAELRTAWNQIVASARKENGSITKKDVREVFFARPQNLEDLVEVYRKAASAGYDFKHDPQGLFSWDFIGRQAAAASPLVIANRDPQSIDELRDIVRSIVAQYARNIENNKLYEVLYKENGKPRREVFAQRLFFAVADAYCAANNVDLSREPDAGNGPVDFKVSSGYSGRILVEMKKSDNPKLVHGFETQLVAYQKAEATQESIYVIVRISKSESRIKTVLALRDEKIKQGVRVPEVFVIDARRKLSASKRKKG